MKTCRECAQQWQNGTICPACGGELLDDSEDGSALVGYLLFLAIVFTLMFCVTINGRHPAMILGREVLNVMPVDWDELWPEPPPTLPVTDETP